MRTAKRRISGTRIAPWMILVVSAALAACGHSEQPVPAPAAATVAPASAPTTVPAAQAATVTPAPATQSAVPATTSPAAASAPRAATAIAAAPAATTKAGPESAGSVALAEGSVTDRATDGSTRALKDGDTVYPGDAFTLGDASYLDLDLEDGGRILLRPDTSFQIQEYHFDPDAHPAAGAPVPPANPQQTPESAFFNLLKGGLRAVDGLIGQSQPRNYAIDTPVATIGVRGTAFDVRYCGDDCKDEADATGAPKNGLYTAVSEGSIGVKNDGGETVTKAGEYSYVQTRKAAAQRMDHAPRALRHMSLPPVLKARADKNRQAIQQQRQTRRQQVLERRRQQAAGKPGATVQRPEQAKAPPAGKQEPTAERREQRMPQRQENMRQAPKQENRQPEAGGGQRPARSEQPARQDQQQKAAPESDQERRQQRQQQIQQRREERQAGKAGEQRQQLKREQQQKKGGCKGKKRRKKRGNQGGCGG